MNETIAPNLEDWQYVRSSKGGGPGYWRRRSKHEPSRAQALQRLRMAKLSWMLYGAGGSTTNEKGKIIPRNAALVGPLLRGSPVSHKKNGI